MFGLIWIECGIKMVVIGCRNWYIGMNIGNECGDNEGMSVGINCFYHF